ncbi:SDR family NAD(P)-dependent oxidoreductase [Paenibacillus nasutitermitis]|uniref:Beta-ketoacyl-ACP reductase n=1 Tax=Paenibacillus nasutitermitis TaxID=1652958 RepID=A0A916YQT9_9BACL|nr:glucose 1-dehydrogenase [Paenibacillus nasutitermitis]GGD57128.1 beta-ketoacyl-ACP reductase [Paenibacillus nasutitermitis]
MRLAEKTALVTGAGTGIGKGIAIELARRGAKVAVHYNQSSAGALDTLQQIHAFGGQAFVVQGNVAHKKEIDVMVQEVIGRYGTIDILVNNAALQLNYGFFDHTEATFDTMMHINLKGYWQCIQAVVPHMKAKKTGRIINISSVHAKRPTDFDAVYAMTKGGIRMLGRECAIELGRYGITVNTIEPGAVDVGKFKVRTSSGETGAARSRTEDIRMKFPLGRVGKPHDVAQLVCFLASDESEFISGAAIRLDGASMLL